MGVPLGIYARPLTDSERQALQTYLAMRIVAVVQGSPAFLADVLPGDCLMGIGSDATYSHESLYAAINKNHGKNVTLILTRHGEKLSKRVSIASDP